MICGASLYPCWLNQGRRRGGSDGKGGEGHQGEEEAQLSEEQDDRLLQQRQGKLMKLQNKSLERALHISPVHVLLHTLVTHLPLDILLLTHIFFFATLYPFTSHVPLIVNSILH